MHDPEGIIATASLTLKADAYPDKLTLDTCSDGIRVSGMHGLCLLEQFARMERRFEGLESEVARLNDLAGSQQYHHRTGDERHRPAKARREL